MQYTVKLERTTIEHASISVSASTATQAEGRIRHHLNNGELDPDVLEWFAGETSAVEVVSVEPEQKEQK